ncbi:Type I restriction-modification system, restriction subunit R [Methanosarcina mazei Tuc01]|uniref:Type I restriction-modification system, restriction subunit R n=1 Tax=Methanosarcina mazei Tuc01 TaxID=1236903 RepID=M1Q6Y1_METMZ|nr:Type I restriction-modification system, restriction subunit R [Methanosarcina mazei Tuc01]
MQKVTLADRITTQEESFEIYSDYSEDSLVEKSAILEFKKLGYICCTASKSGSLFANQKRSQGQSTTSFWLRSSG